MTTSLDVTARNALVEEHLRWAQNVAWQFIRGRMEQEDLMQEAMLALIDVANRYDPTKGTFRTIAYQRMRGAVADAVRMQMRKAGWVRGSLERRYFISSVDAPSRDGTPEYWHPEIPPAENRILDYGIRGNRRERRVLAMIARGDTMREAGLAIGVGESRTSQMIARVGQRTRARMGCS